MIKRLLIFFLLFSNIFILTFAANETISQEKIEKYNETGYYIYLGFITLFAIGLIITLVLIQSNYGMKKMLEIIGFVLFILLLYWLFRIA